MTSERVLGITILVNEPAQLAFSVTVRRSRRVRCGGVVIPDHTLEPTPNAKEPFLLINSVISLVLHWDLHFFVAEIWAKAA